MEMGTDRQTRGCPRQRMTTTAPERQVRPKQRRCALRRVRRPTVTVRSGGWKAGESVLLHLIVADSSRERSPQLCSCSTPALRRSRATPNRNPKRRSATDVAAQITSPKMKGGSQRICAAAIALLLWISGFRTLFSGGVFGRQYRRPRNYPLHC